MTREVNSDTQHHTQNTAASARKMADDQRMQPDKRAEKHVEQVTGQVVEHTNEHGTESPTDSTQQTERATEKTEYSRKLPASHPQTARIYLFQAAHILLSISLCIFLLTCGLFVCMNPHVTRACARASIEKVAAKDAVQLNRMFTQYELVYMAGELRDYSFGAHNKKRLLYAQLKINAAQGRNVNAKVRSALADTYNTHKAIKSMIKHANASFRKHTIMQQAPATITKLDERFFITPAALTHLDDVYTLGIIARKVSIASAVVSLVLAALLFFMKQRVYLGRSLKHASVVTLVLLACGILASLFNFTDFFTHFHEALFPQGNWSFSADSLLISALPEAFWQKLALIWGATSVLGAIVCFLLGFALTRRTKQL